MYIVQAGGAGGLSAIHANILSPFNSAFSLGHHLYLDASTIPTLGSAVYPVANQAIGIPFWLSSTTTYLRYFVQNGTVAAGNFEIGIYTSAFAKVQTTGSIAQTGTSVMQAGDFSLTLSPGQYYLWFSGSDATATYIRTSVGSVQRMAAMGCFQQTSVGPGSAPSTATPVTIVSAYMPVFGLSRVTI